MRVDEVFILVVLRPHFGSELRTTIIDFLAGAQRAPACQLPRYNSPRPRRYNLARTSTADRKFTHKRVKML